MWEDSDKTPETAKVMHFLQESVMDLQEHVL